MKVLPDPTDSQLAFDESRHLYYLNGAPVPSVTAVLEDAGLIDYGFLGARRELYLARGQAVHLATADDDHGSLAEDSVPPEIAEYLEAWRAFKRTYCFRPMLIEHRVSNPLYVYAGTLDRVGSIRDGTEILVDIKTGVAPAWTAVQLAAYAACLPHPRTRRRRCVELHRNGTYKVIPYETSHYQRDLDTFARALETFRAKRRNDAGHDARTRP
jgi:hypothetical protein